MRLFFWTTILLLFLYTNLCKADEVYPKIYNKTPNEVRVMVIDTGIYPHILIKKYLDKQNLDLYPKNYEDHEGHGTHVTGLILHGELKTSIPGYDAFSVDPVCPNVKIYSCKFYDRGFSSDEEMAKIRHCYYKAVALKIDIINMSGGGTDFSSYEERAIREYLKYGGIMVVAAGNNSKNIDTKSGAYFPASYNLKGITPVGAAKRGKAYNYYNKMRFSNYGMNVRWELGDAVLSTMPSGLKDPPKYDRMNGTSMAAPLYLHAMLKNKCKEF